MTIVAVRYNDVVRLFSRNTVIRKGQVKAHYRKLKNGQIIRIESYFDKRKAAQKNPDKHRNKVVHVDANSTSRVNGKGEIETSTHKPQLHELTDEHIYGQLNRAVSIDDSLADSLVRHTKGIESEGDMNELLDSIVHASENPEMAEGLGMKAPKDVTNRKDAYKWYQKHVVRPAQKELRKKYGESSTLAQIYTSEHDDIRDMIDAHAEDSSKGHHKQALARMAQDHSEAAIDDLVEQRANIEAAKYLTKEDCPVIPSLNPDLGLFGHQAEVLAKLNVLKQAVIDVDMGGGKGLLLPADAMNLMAQGKIKKPLVVAPTNTVEQNALKTINEYSSGKMNVFKITNEVINKEYDGDVSKMVEDIENAPPNTIFMAGYDVLGYQKRNEDGSIVDGDEKFERAQMLASAGFDYTALDESHNAKNPTSNRWKSLQYFTAAKYRRIASGTFVSNNPQDVLGQMKWLHPSWDMSSDKFKEAYGHESTSEGVRWSPEGLKSLRADMEDLGSISIRRSGWMHILPKRDENLSVSNMTGKHAAVNEAAVTQILDDIEAQMMKDPKFATLVESGADLDKLIENNPKLQGALNFLGGITDYPHEVSEMISQAYETFAEGQEHVHESEDEMGEVNLTFEDDEVRQAYDTLQKIPQGLRKSLLGLKNVVSPKAKDCYSKIEDHIKNPKNGKFIVMCQRKLSAKHIIDNMPDHLKEHVMYYDASQADKLPDFTENPKGPKVMVAVDASITEGINMQIANGLYRYDHHYSPGTQEQSYARVWRFGQDKAVKIHNGIVNNGVDVTKYARMMTKHHQNMLATSDLPEEETDYAYRLSLDNIRNNRSADILPKYEGLGKSILDFQHKENKGLQKKYGSKPLNKSDAKTQIGGNEAKIMHGTGAYQTEFTGKQKEAQLSHDEKDALVGHFRDAMIDAGVDEIYSPDTWKNDFPLVAELAGRHKLKGDSGEKVSKDTMESLAREYEHDTGEKMDETQHRVFAQTINNWSEGKKHEDHDAHDYHSAIMSYEHEHDIEGFDTMDEYDEDAEDLEDLMKHVKKNKLSFDHKDGKVKNIQDFDGFWKKWQKKWGEKPSNKQKQVLLGAASYLHDHSKGWESLKGSLGGYIRESED